MRSRTGIALVAATLALLPVGGRAQSQAEPQAGSQAGSDWGLVRISFSSGWDALPALVALERGFTMREGLVVSGLALSSGMAVIKSLAAGSTDFAVVPQRTLLVMAAAGAPVKVVAMSGWGTRSELLVRRDVEGIASVADLKGKVVAVNHGSEALPLLVRLLNGSGLRIADLTIKSMPGKELSEAFSAPHADAVCASAHFTGPLLQSGQARRLLTYEQIVEAIGVVGAAPLVVSSKLIERDPASVQKFVNAWVRALQYIQEDPEDAAKLLAIYFHRQGVPVSEEQARTWVDMTRYDRYFWTASDITDAEYNAWGLKEGGILKVLPELEGYIDNRFAQRALQQIEASAEAEKP
jgi:NitT/TauT family transport system substrate-binding protein